MKFVTGHFFIDHLAWVLNERVVAELQTSLFSEARLFFSFLLLNALSNFAVHSKKPDIGETTLLQKKCGREKLAGHSMWYVTQQKRIFFKAYTTSLGHQIERKKDDGINVSSYHEFGV